MRTLSLSEGSNELILRKSAIRFGRFRYDYHEVMKGKWLVNIDERARLTICIYAAFLANAIFKGKYLRSYTC